MKHTRVVSSNVDSIGWESQTLEVRFLSGHTYRYFHVGRHVYRNLLAAASVGSYLAKHIKGKYPYARVCECVDRLGRASVVCQWCKGEGVIYPL